MISESSLKGSKQEFFVERRKPSGRPPIFPQGKKTVPIEIPLEWEKEKLELQQGWRYILRKGLDALQKRDNVEEDLKYMEELAIKNNDRFNRAQLDIMSLRKELDALKGIR